MPTASLSGSALTASGAARSPPGPALRALRRDVDKLTSRAAIDAFLDRALDEGIDRYEDLDRRFVVRAPRAPQKEIGETIPGQRVNDKPEHVSQRIPTAFNDFNGLMVGAAGFEPAT